MGMILYTLEIHQITELVELCAKNILNLNNSMCVDHRQVQIRETTKLLGLRKITQQKFPNVQHLVPPI